MVSYSCQLPLVPSVDTAEKSTSPYFSFPPVRYLYTLTRSPQILLSSRLNNTNSVSLSSSDWCSSPLGTFVALHWIRSCKSTSFVDRGAQIRTKYCRCGLTRVAQGGRITSRNPPATLFLMKPRKLLASFVMRVHWWFTVSLLSTRISRSISAALLSSQSVPSSSPSSMTIRSREVILPLCSTLMRPHLESCIQLCSPHPRKDMELLERAHWRSQNWSEGWNPSPRRKGWESWDCSVWRREGSGETLLQPFST